MLQYFTPDDIDDLLSNAVFTQDYFAISMFQACSFFESVESL